MADRRNHGTAGGGRRLDTSRGRVLQTDRRAGTPCL